MIQKTYQIIGMHCQACANIIQNKLSALPQISNPEVNYATETLTFDTEAENLSLTTLNQPLAPLGYSLKTNPVDSDLTVPGLEKQHHLNQLKHQTLVGLPLVIFSLLIMFWDFGASLKIWPGMPDFIEVFVHHLLPVFATYMLFVIGIPYLKAIVRLIRYGVANMDTLVGLGTTVAFFYSLTITAFEKILSPYLNTKINYYDVTIVVLGFITLGKYLETKSKYQTGEAIQKLLALQVKTALVLRHGKEVEISINNVVVGDILVVKPGQKIPTDGEIIKGRASLDQSLVTGESLPVEKTLKDKVIGSTLNLDGQILVKATKVGSDTFLAQIIQLVTVAQNSRAPIQRLADQVSSVFVPVVLVIAVISFFTWLFLNNPTMALKSFVGVLVIACPCAMGLATPTAVIAGVGKAAEHGILIKSAESLEKFSQVNYLVLDKTGTLTQGSPKITDIETVSPKLNNKELLRLAASLENFSSHPLANAVVSKAKEEKISLIAVNNFKNLSGYGLEGTIEKTLYFAGSPKFARKFNLKPDTKLIDTYASQGKTPILLFTKKEILGYLALADTLKSDAIDTIQKLRRLQLKVAILTGDNQKTANYLGQKAGINLVKAEILPAEKLREIQSLQSLGYRVAMVGDGINDAPALATADVGIAMSTGTDIAIESAGVTLLGGRLSQIPKAFILSRSTIKIIRQNLFWAFFYNILGIPIAAGLFFPIFHLELSPVVAGAAMAFSSVSVVTNSLRLKSLKL